MATTSCKISWKTCSTCSLHVQQTQAFSTTFAMQRFVQQIQAFSTTFAVQRFRAADPSLQHNFSSAALRVADPSKSDRAVAVFGDMQSLFKRERRERARDVQESKRDAGQTATRPNRMLYSSS